MIKNALNVQQRLMRHTKYNESSGCLEWFGSKRNGYGRMIIGSRTDGTRKSVSAHRISYELTYGEIPIGMEVCHKCDNPSCVNPSHLFLGTRQDNIDDRERKGRNNPPKGEKHAKSQIDRSRCFDNKDKAIARCIFWQIGKRIWSLQKDHSRCR